MTRNSHELQSQDYVSSMIVDIDGYTIKLNMPVASNNQVNDQIFDTIKEMLLKSYVNTGTQ